MVPDPTLGGGPPATRRPGHIYDCIGYLFSVLKTVPSRKKLLFTDSVSATEVSSLRFSPRSSRPSTMVTLLWRCLDCTATWNGCDIWSPCTKCCGKNIELDVLPSRPTRPPPPPPPLPEQDNVEEMSWQHSGWTVEHDARGGRDVHVAYFKNGNKLIIPVVEELGPAVARIGRGRPQHVELRPHWVVIAEATADK